MAARANVSEEHVAVDDLGQSEGLRFERSEIGACRKRRESLFGVVLARYANELPDPVYGLVPDVPQESKATANLEHSSHLRNRNGVVEPMESLRHYNTVGPPGLDRQRLRPRAHRPGLMHARLEL